MLPVMAKSPPTVPAPITAKLARELIPPFSIVSPPTTAFWPLAVMLPFKNDTPAVLKYVPLVVMLPASLIATVLAVR